MTTIRNPAPVDVPTQTTVIPLSQIDRAPAPVPASSDPGISGSGTTTVTTPPVSEQPVDTTGASADSGSVVVNQPPYLAVADEGSTVLDRTTVLNFAGNAVTVTQTGSSTATVTITSTGGGSSYGNSNVASLLSSFGSNTISTTGNITGGNIFGNIVAPDGNGSVVINASGILGSAPGFSYDQSANMLFTPGITAEGSANTGINAMYGGIGGYTVLGSDVMVQLTSNLNAYTQINAQNINPGSFASSDYIITADNGTDSTYYLDLGLAGSGHSDPDFFGDAVSANDGYLYVTATDQAGPSNGAGNLLIGSTNGVIKLFVGNTAQANVIATVESNGININGAITSNSTINIDNRASGNAADVQLYAADDILLQARNRTTGSTSEGGDINIYAGDSAEDGDSSGGDIQIFAGDGGAANVDFGGSGGFITIRSGQGGSAIGDGVSSAESGGSLTLEAGDAGGNNGNIDRGAAGGDVFITAGDSTGNLDAGGDIILTTGTAGSNALAGNVQITIPSSDLSSGGNWTFGATGNLTLPRGGVVYETNIPFGGLSGNTIALAPSGGIDADQQLLVYPTAGADANHLHLTSGNLYNTELFVGDDNLYVKLANTGNIVINSNDGTGNSAQWTFGTDGNLILAGGNSVIQSIANSSLDPLNANVSTMVLTPDANYNSQVLVLDPTSPGHIHLRALAFGNIDEPAANLFLGGETTAFEITYGPGSEARIHSGGNTWTFANDGNITTPQGMVVAGNVNFLGTDTALLNPANNVPLSLISSGANGTVTSYWAEDIGNVMTSNIAAIYVPLQGTGTVRIVTGNNSGNVAIYDFDNAGVFTTANVSATYAYGNTIEANVFVGGTANISGNVLAGNVIVTSSIVGSGASPAPTLSGFSTISTAGAQGNITASGNLIANAAVIATGNVSGGNIITGGLISATGDITAAVSVTAPLPLANLTAVAGARAFVNNANLVATGNFGSQISGGGSNTVPVWSDGTNWYIG